MLRVIVESPYAGKTPQDVLLNEIYGEFCLHDCLINHNESPFASHLLYTRQHVLRDHISEERKLGIKAGFYWREVAQKTVFYTDLGSTSGMIQGLEDCKEKGLPYEVRVLPPDIMKRFKDYVGME